jgi:hypothetical protein
MDSHTWSYEELTVAIEREVARQLKKAREAPSEVTRRACQDYAVGAYFAWESIMRAHLTERRFQDGKRLGAMVSPPEGLIQPAGPSVPSGDDR